MFSMQLYSVYNGYWSAYFTNSKHPKSVDSIIKKMSKEYSSQEKVKKVTAAEPDVATFIELDKKLAAAKRR